MRRSRARELERRILKALRQKEIDVKCGNCSAVMRANWSGCIVRNVVSWIARSECMCPACRCTVLSYLGDSVPLSMVRDELGPGALAEENGRADLPAIYSFVQQALRS